MQESGPIHHVRQVAARDLLVAFLVCDFLIRGHLWVWVKHHYGLSAGLRCYWICDSVTYALGYGALFLLTIEWWMVSLIMGIALSFAFNKVVESIFTDEIKFDWTEYAAIIFSIAYVCYKLRK